MTSPLITPHLDRRRLTNRPQPPGSHVAEQAFGVTHEIGSVARVAFAERLRAVFLMRAGNELAAQGHGAFGRLGRAMGGMLAFEFETMIFPEGDPGAGRDCVLEPFEVEFVVVVADEELGGSGAVVGWIGWVGGGEVCEILSSKR